MSPYNALIRTHHITSRTKIAKLGQAARTHNVYALLCSRRSPGLPGIMYVEGAEADVGAWVGAVSRLRYKYYHLAKKPAPVATSMPGIPSATAKDMAKGSIGVVDSVKAFSQIMRDRGVLEWWREGMGYVDSL